MAKTTDRDSKITAEERELLDFDQPLQDARRFAYEHDEGCWRSTFEDCQSGLLPAVKWRKRWWVPHGAEKVRALRLFRPQFEDAE